MNRKSALELSFNFIFAMISAVVIFTIAFGVISSITKTATAEKSLELKTYITNQFSSNLNQGGESDYIPLSSNMIFSQSCDKISFLENSIDTYNYPVFSLGKIKTNTLGISTKKILLPTYISNVVYLYPPSKIYLYCKDCDNPLDVPDIFYLLSRSIKPAKLASFKDVLEIKIIGKEFDLTNEEIKQIKKSDILVYPDNENAPENLCNYFICKEIKVDDSYKFQDFYKNLVYSNRHDYPVGFVSFNGNTMYFLGEESLFGALLSDNASLYDCNLLKMLFGINRISSVNKKRLEILEFEGGAFSTDDNCKEIYTSSVTAYEGLLKLLDDLVNQDDDYNPNTITLDVLKDIRKSIFLLSELNYNATRYSCPNIY